MKKSILLSAALMLSSLIGTVTAEEQKLGVNLKNFNTVETHIQMDRYQKITGGINILKHSREMVAIDKQTTIAMNRDTLYSFAVLDLSKPVTITMPKTDKRFMALQIIDEDHYSPFVFEKPGEYTLTEKNVGTRYAVVAIRTFADPNSPADMKAVHALQDKVKLEGGGDTAFTLPNYDMKAYKSIFSDIQKLIKYWDGDTAGSMGKRGELNELIHTVATAAGWGLNPPENAMYIVVNKDMDPKKKYKVVVPAKVPVNAFWSLSVYNKGGFFGENKLNAYTVNDVTGHKSDDGTTAIYLGACEDEKYNCLPLPGEGSYLEWRLYAPQQPVLDGKWSFPDVVEVK
jgi:hypothetical protein